MTKNTKTQKFMPGFDTRSDYDAFVADTDALRVEAKGGFLNPNNTNYEEVVDANGRMHILPTTLSRVEADAIADANAMIDSEIAWDKIKPEAHPGKGDGIRIIGAVPVETAIQVEFTPHTQHIDVQHVA